MSVRLKSALLAAGLALVASGAEATIVNGSFDSGQTGWDGTKFTVNNSAGSFAAMFTANSNQVGTLSQTLASAFNGYIGFSYLMDPGTLTFLVNNSQVAQFTAGVSQFTTYQSPLLTLAANSVISFTFTPTTNGGKAYIDNVTSAAVPVPGPIAGAGLPILVGVAGFAAWRRRKARNAA